MLAVFASILSIIRQRPGSFQYRQWVQVCQIVRVHESLDRFSAFLTKRTCDAFGSESKYGSAANFSPDCGKHRRVRHARGDEILDRQHGAST